MTAFGEPVPPQEAVRRLREIDERLSVKWVPSAAGAYWGIIEQWKESDPRWEYVKRGEFTRDQTYDLRAMLPPDCSAEEAVGFVERYFRPVGHAATDAAEAIAKVTKFNKSVKEKHVENFMAEQDDKQVRTTKHELEVQLGVATAHPISHGIGDSPRLKRRKAAGSE